jgi:hypothetical protein
VSSPGCAPASKQDSWLAQRPALQSWTRRHVRGTHTPQQASSVLRLFESLRLRRKCAAELSALVARARRFTPGVADRVATLARINPDAALETFVSAFQQRHFELDESVVDQGFEFWAEENADFIPVLMRGTDRCNGIERLGYRPGYTLQWALIQDAFFADERSEVIAEVADAFGPEIADRLASVQPPEHHVLCRRLNRSPYRGIVAFSRWALGDVPFNPVCTTMRITLTSCAFAGQPVECGALRDWFAQLTTFKGDTRPRALDRERTRRSRPSACRCGHRPPRSEQLYPRRHPALRTLRLSA